MEEASVGRACGRRGADRGGDTGREDASAWTGGDVGWGTITTDVGCSCKVDGAVREESGNGGVLAVRSGTAEEDLGVGERRLAAALAVACPR